MIKTPDGLQDLRRKIYVDFRILCPILPELMSNYLAG
jgi:hypothetical protein